MKTLCEQSCQPCEGNEPPLARQEAGLLLKQLDQWQLAEHENVLQLVKMYRFKNFQLALNFTNMVGAIAEEQQHHPALYTQWGRVTVTLWTHAIHGLQMNDFIMAAKCDERYEQFKAQNP